MRLCPKLMEKSNMDEAIGLTIYHELQHVTSAVYDHETHAYGKKNMV
jgi:hypothetical protein